MERGLRLKGNRKTMNRIGRNCFMLPCFRLNCFGQTSVEFLFLFLIMLFYLQVIIQPSVEESSASISSINQVGQAKLAAMKIANSVNEISALSGESSKQIWVFLDESTSLWCNEAEKKIEFKATTESNLPECGGTECTGSIKLLDDIELNCSNFATTEGKVTPKAKVRIWKEGGTTYVQRIE